MSKQIASIPLANIDRIQIYINPAGKTLAQIKQETGADYVINGGLFEGKKAVCHLKADGYVHASDPYTYWGYAWDNGSDIKMQVIPAASARNYICCVELLRGKVPNLNPIYSKALGGRRGRTAMGIKDGCLCLYVTGDGTTDAKTPEQLRDELAALGWESAVMLDGGGSSQCDFVGQRITSSRKVHNLILVYLKTEDKLMSDKKYTVCLDPGHGPDTKNGDPDGTYLEQEFCWDMAVRVRALLEAQGISVVVTRQQSAHPSLTARAKVSNDAKADLFISIHSDAAAGSGWSTASGLHIFTSSGPDTAKRNVAARAILARMQQAGVKLFQVAPRHNINMTVLAATNAPACLIEYGFHTHREEVALLKTDSYREKLAEATAKGICDFLGVVYTEDKPTAETLPEAVKWAVEQGIILGDDKGNLGLGNTLTKEQGCTMLHRVYQLVKSGK